MVRSTTTILKLICFAALNLLALLQFQFALQQQQVFIGAIDETKASASRNARMLTNLGKEKHLFEADLKSAVFYLQKALIINPLYVPAWLAIAVVRNDQGEQAQSSRILSYAHHLTADIKRWRWDKVLTAYQLGQAELLPVELSYIIKEIPGKSRRAALQLAFTTWPDPEDLVDNLGQENLGQLFSYASSRKDTEKILYFYEIMDDLDVDIDRKQLLGAIEMLLRNGKAQHAGIIWRARVNPDSLLYNGDFSQPFIQTAFGWRKTKHPSAALTIDGIRGAPDKKTLHVRFKGWENVKFHHLFQIIPVEPGKTYQLTSRLKTDKLTTDQRPFFEVSGYNCEEFTRQKSDMFPDTTDWRTIGVEFAVPENCTTAVVRLRRLESNHIDSKISGHLWLTNVAVKEVETTLFPQEQL